MLTPSTACFLGPRGVHIPNSISIGLGVFRRPFVKRFSLCYIGPLSVCLSVCPVCMSVLSITLVYCGQTVGWINMRLRMEVGLGPDHIVLDGDPTPPWKGARSPHFSAKCLLWPNGCPSQQQLSSCCTADGRQPLN